jgi:hypothetical protein
MSFTRLCYRFGGRTAKMLTQNAHPLVALAISAIVLQLLLSNSVGAITADEYAARCNKARADCGGEGNENCAKWRDAFNAHGSVCPGVNAPSTATIKGPDTKFAVSSPDTANMSAEDAKRCQSAAAVCASGVGDPTFCMTYKKNFTSEGLNCPGVNAPSLSTTSGAPSTPAYTSSGPVRVEASLQYARSSNAGDTLANIQAECDAARGHNGFGSQVKCIKSGIQNSVGLASADSGDVQLYVLTADKLVDDVARKQITVAAARVELQKAFLEFRERTNRKNAEASNRAYAVRLEAQAQQTEVERKQAAAEAEARAAEAARQYEQAQANAQMMAAIQNCVALAYERQNALATSPNASVRNMANGQQGLRNFAGVTMESACQRDPNWYRTIPVAPLVQRQQRSHCDSDLQGGFDCTTQ